MDRDTPDRANSRYYEDETILVSNTAPSGRISVLLNLAEAENPVFMWEGGLERCRPGHWTNHLYQLYREKKQLEERARRENLAPLND